MSLFQELQAYYESLGVSPLDFRCRHIEQCNERQIPTFTTGNQAFVGTEYDKGALPRVLFVSLDSGEAPEEPEKRTMEFIRQWEENDTTDNFPKNRHWYQTHNLAYTILKMFNPYLTLEGVKPCFAHTNSAKCCEKNPNNRQAHNVLFKNCREFLRGELQILAPDILITQGGWAKSAVETNFTPCDDQHWLNGLNPDCPALLLPIAGHTVIWIHTYHPSARFGRFPTQRSRCWDFWADLAFKFIQDHR